MQSISSASIVSLAMLKVNWDQDQNDYLQLFFPFVSEAIYKDSDEFVSTTKIKQSIRDNFGIDLPENVINTILRRIEKDGFIYREHGVYRKDYKNFKQSKFSERRQKATEDYEKFMKMFQEHCKNEHGAMLNSVEAETAVHAYIDENQIEILENINMHQTIVSSNKYPTKSGKFLVGSFIQFLVGSNSSEYYYFESIVKGTMLSNAAFLPNPNHSKKRFKNTDLFFDSPFIMEALGYVTDAKKEVCLDLIKLVVSMEGKLKCYKNTLNEVKGILNASISFIKSHTYPKGGPLRVTVEQFFRRFYSESDVIIQIENLEKNLKAIAIEIAEEPHYSEQNVTIDENALYNALNDNPGADYGFYMSEMALRHDVNCIAAIMRQRGKVIPDQLETSLAIFVTKNTRLTKISRRICYNNRSECFPPAIFDETLANLLWLKQPKSVPNLPRKQIIANFYAAIQPSDILWRRYSDETEKMKINKDITTDDYYILMFSTTAKQLLMEETLGSEDVFTNGTISEILAKVRQNMIELEKEEADKLVRQKDDRISFLEKQLASQEQDKTMLANLLDRDTQQKNTSRERRVAKINRFWEVSITAIFAILQGISLIPGILGSNFVPFYISTGINLLLFVPSIVNQVFGTPLITPIKYFSNFLSQKTVKFIDLINQEYVE